MECKVNRCLSDRSCVIRPCERALSPLRRELAVRGTYVLTRGCCFTLCRKIIQNKMSDSDPTKNNPDHIESRKVSSEFCKFSIVLLQFSIVRV